ncbi:MAG: 3-isopropylmalate dehydratase small subunit [Bacteroidales bacterium]|jgi:3-isopropylmalate/(R)-2-methylmalate dehydratase small subunit|nr:3-isopropylmalate dehydratase small subunit [Bacteroidales bacterium]MCI2144874.1 3-isopropylmalate dehydratase small subunit [Bacteroidales bacterium]
MRKTVTIESTAVLLDVNNIDTDQIIPARFLKAVSRDSFGEKLFYNWRYRKDGSPDESFALNRSKGSVLVAGANFGCGSSREHAAWALADYGFGAVVASSFADIFRNNALNNGLVPVQVSPGFLERAVSAIRKDPDTKIDVDLSDRSIRVEGVGMETFPIGEYKRECLMKGYDDMDYLLSILSDIEKFEKRNAI